MAPESQRVFRARVTFAVPCFADKGDEIFGLRSDLVVTPSFSAGDSGWLEGLGPNAHKHEYNILLLRSWAKRSPDLLKLHVIVLLLTILDIEAR